MPGARLTSMYGPVPLAFSDAKLSSFSLKFSGFVTLCFSDHALLMIHNGVEVLQEDRVHRCQLELDRQLVDLLRRADLRRVVRDLRRRLFRALDRKDDVVGGERRAVVELDVRPQLEAPQRRRHLRPLAGEAGHDRELFVARGQAFVHLAVHHVGHRLVLRVRIHRLWIALAGPAQHLRLANGADKSTEAATRPPTSERFMATPSLSLQVRPV